MLLFLASASVNLAVRKHRYENSGLVLVVARVEEATNVYLCVGTIIGFDEYMNLVLDDAEEIKQVHSEHSFGLLCFYLMLFCSRTIRRRELRWDASC